MLNTADLAEAIKIGNVAGACLDVLEYELKSFENLDPAGLPGAFKYLAASDKVVFTPHVAGWTVESYEKLSTVLYDKIHHAFGLSN